VSCIVFSFKNNFFLRETRDGSEGVQRRGHVKGAASSRSSQTLDREHRWNNAGLVRRGLSGEKNERKTTSAKNTEWEGVWFRLSEDGEAGKTEGTGQY
jgi:hypothetical protein